MQYQSNGNGKITLNLSLTRLMYAFIVANRSRSLRQTVFHAIFLFRARTALTSTGQMRTMMEQRHRRRWQSRGAIRVIINAYHEPRSILFPTLPPPPSHRYHFIAINIYLSKEIAQRAAKIASNGKDWKSGWCWESESESKHVYLFLFFCLRKVSHRSAIPNENVFEVIRTQNTLRSRSFRSSFRRDALEHYLSK